MSETKAAMSPEMEKLKTRLKAVWSAGDFGQIAEAYLAGAAEFVERLNLKPGEKVLDVGCGAGSTALPAARAGGRVTGVDLAPVMVEEARKNAEAEGLNCRFEEGDAEALSFEDESFDTVISIFGAMFAPRPERVAAELIRVCRAGGRIAMGNWTPSSFVGQMLKIHGAHVPPPAGMPSPALWGDEATLRERLKDGIAGLQIKKRLMKFSFPFSPEETVEHFRRFYGPSQKTFDALEADEEKQSALRGELENHWKTHNQATDGTTTIESEYLEVIAHRL